MGLSASQGRFLQLTSRMSDLEFEAQQISNQRIRLSDSTQSLTDKYTAELATKQLVFMTDAKNNQYVNLTAGFLMDYNPDSIEAQRILSDASGKALITETMMKSFNTSNNDVNVFLINYGVDVNDIGAVAYYTNLFNKLTTNGYITTEPENLGNSEWLYQQLQNGGLFIEKFSKAANQGEGGFDKISWKGGDPSIQEISDTTNMAVVKAEYDSAMSKIQSQDKKFETELKQIETAHSALQTEYDTVKKIMDKNIEGSFKSFG